MEEDDDDNGVFSMDAAADVLEEEFSEQLVGVELLRELLLQNICCCIHREHAVVIVILFHGVAWSRRGRFPLRTETGPAT